MKRWAQLWLPIAVLAQAAHAAELQLEIEIAPPDPEWLLPAEASPPPCYGGFYRLEACPRQQLPEGMVLVGEQSLALELAPLLAVGLHRAVLARVALNGIELELLEAGDLDGFLRTRTPTDGDEAWLLLGPPPETPGNARRPTDGPTIDDPERPTESPRPPPTPTRNVTIPTRAPSLPDFVSATMLYVIGHTYFALQEYVPAETAFRLALLAVPDHIRAHESLGMLYLRTERYADARVHLARAVALGRNTAHVYAAVGYLEQQTQRYWAAAAAFQRTLALEPGNRGAQRGLLLALTETRDLTKARALVEELLQTEPHDLDLWLYRAQIELSANKQAAALTSLETALRLGDDSVTNRAACIALHIESGSIARAMELLQGSSARGLEYPLVERVLGWLANENRWDDFRELAASVDRAALGGVEQSRLLTLRASLALHDGNRRAASTALQEAVALDPSNGDALLALGGIYRTERDYGRADLLFQRAGSYGPVRDSALIARAELAIDQEDFDGAIAHLRNVVSANLAPADLRRNVTLLERLALLRTQR
jgi:tetratricopeptide (TPR) repeat protein